MRIELAPNAVQLIAIATNKTYSTRVLAPNSSKVKIGSNTKVSDNLKSHTLFNPEEHQNVQRIKFTHALLQSLRQTYRLMGSKNYTFRRSLGQDLAKLNDKQLVKCYKYHTSQYIQTYAVESERTDAPPEYNPQDWFFNQHNACYIKRRCMKFKYAFQLWQSKRAVSQPLPQSLKDEDYESFRSRLTTTHKTPSWVLDELSKRSKEYFKDFNMPDLKFRTTKKACFEAPHQNEYVKDHYDLPNLTDRYSTLHQLTHHNLVKKLPIVPPLPVGRSKQLDEPLKVRTITAMNHESMLFKDLQEELLHYIQRDPTFILTKNGGDVIAATNYMAKFPGTFRSGDFEAATDNIHRDVIESVLSGINMTDIAKAQLGRVLVDSFITTNGQLMGSILSFPILCVINKFVHQICLEYVQGSSEPRINGDDILFKSSDKFFEQWQDLCQACGLIPSKGKNLCHQRYFTINSRPFVVTNGVVQRLKFGNFKLCKMDFKSFDEDVVQSTVENIKKFHHETFGEVINPTNIHKSLRFFRHFGKHPSFKIMKKYRSDYLPISIGGTGLFHTNLDKATDLQICYANKFMTIKNDGISNLQRDLGVKPLLLKTLVNYKKLPKLSINPKTEDVQQIKSNLAPYLTSEIKIKNKVERYNHQEGVWAFHLKRKVVTTAVSQLV